MPDTPWTIQVRPYGIGGKWRNKATFKNEADARKHVKELVAADERRSTGSRYQYRVIQLPWTHR